MRDLFDHKEAIFGELKRQTSAAGQLGGPGRFLPAGDRMRATSITDESNRRAKMEARAKAISERTRDKSPAPTQRHRREKSTDGSISTRFPVVVNPSTARTSLGMAGNRQSLEVPGSTDNSPQTERTFTTPKLLPGGPEAAKANGSSPTPADNIPGTFVGGGPGPHICPTDSSPVFEPASSIAEANDIEKQASLRRNTAGSGRSRKGTSSGKSTLSNRKSLEGMREGVTLTDKPMED